MKVILLVTALLVGAVCYGQGKALTPTVQQGQLIEKQKNPELENQENAFDGTFYIITDKDAPESFMNNIYTIVEESRKKNKEVKMHFGERSTLIILSKKVIKKKNFEPVKTMIQLK